MAKKVKIYKPTSSIDRATLKACNDATPDCITYAPVEDALGRKVIPEHIYKHFKGNKFKWNNMVEVDFVKKSDPSENV